MIVDLLGCLPDELVREVLEGWVDMFALVRLDSAYIGNLPYHGALSCQYLEGRTPYELIPGEQAKSAVEWAAKKCLRVNYLSVAVNSDLVQSSVARAFFERQGHSIMYIKCSLCKGANSFLDWIGDYCPELSELELTSAEDVVPIIQLLGKRRDSLRILIINDAILERPAELPAFDLPKMEFLILEDGLHDVEFHASLLLLMCPNIVSLTSSATNYHHLWFTGNNLHLNTLFLRECWRMDDLWLAESVECTSGLRNLYIDCAENLSGDFAYRLVECCPVISSLNIGGTIDEVAWVYLLESYGTRLLNLSVRWWDEAGLTDATALAIAAHCSNLFSLEIEPSRLVSCKALCAMIAKSCVAIPELSIASATHGVTVLRAIAKHCKHLRFLNLYYYQKCTAKAVRAIARACPTLETIVLPEWCPVVCSAVERAYWSATFPGVHIVTKNCATSYWDAYDGCPPMLPRHL